MTYNLIYYLKEQKDKVYSEYRTKEVCKKFSDIKKILKNNNKKFVNNNKQLFVRQFTYRRIWRLEDVIEVKLK